MKKKFRQKQYLTAWARWLKSFPIASMGVIFTVMAVLDDENTGTGLWVTIITVVLSTFPAAYWLYTMNIKVMVDDQMLRVGLWPIPSTKVQIDDIKSVNLVEVSGFSEYWGWGIKGTKKDLFYGLDDGQAVQVIYNDAKKGECSLKIRVDNIEDLARVLNRE